MHEVEKIVVLWSTQSTDERHQKNADAAGLMLSRTLVGFSCVWILEQSLQQALLLMCCNITTTITIIMVIIIYILFMASHLVRENTLI